MATVNREGLMALGSLLITAWLGYASSSASPLAPIIAIPVTKDSSWTTISFLKETQFQHPYIIQNICWFLIDDEIIKKSINNLIFYYIGKNKK